MLKFQRSYFMAENAISRRVPSFYGKFTEWRSRERRWEVIQFFQFRLWLDFDINNILSFVRFFDRYGRVRNIFIKDGKYGFCVSVVCHWLTCWAHQNCFFFVSPVYVFYRINIYLNCQWPLSFWRLTLLQHFSFSI